MAIRFLLAPMAELSHRALRELIESFSTPAFSDGLRTGKAADEYFTEMISAAALANGGPFEVFYADNGPCPEKLVYQIAGGEEDSLLDAAAILDKKECLGIDINMGCSAPAITRTGAGVRWMADIDRSGALIRRLRPLVHRRLSVKLRTGLTDDFDYLVRFCRRLAEEGAELITLHGRTAKEKFRRRARWNYVTALKKELPIPLAGNGDISSAGEMLRYSERCDAVMIGRLAVRRPWVFAEARAMAGKAPDINFHGNFPENGVNHNGVRVNFSDDTVNFSDDNINFPADGPDLSGANSGGRDTDRFTVNLEETGLRFLELLSRYQPAEFHLSRARRFFYYFCDNFKWGNYLKNILNREKDLGGIERAWKNYFAAQGDERWL